MKQQKPMSIFWFKVYRNIGCWFILKARGATRSDFDTLRKRAELINSLWTTQDGYFGEFYKPSPPSTAQIHKALYMSERLA